MSRRIVPTRGGHLISDPFHYLRGEIDRLFDTSTAVQSLRPDFEIRENKDGINVTAELSGVKEDDIDISLTDNVLTISGEKTAEEVKEDETCHLMERSYGSFTRSLKLPYEAKVEKVTASFKDGVLKIHIPKPAVQKPNVHKVIIKK